MHPLATKQVHNNWKVPYRPTREFWSRAMDMLKPDGTLFACGYLWNEGASALNTFPEEERILRTHYYSPLELVMGINVSSIKGFSENVIMIANKQA